MTNLPPLSPVLEAELVRRLAHEFAWRNDLHFGSRLRAPLIALSDAATRLGAWHHASRRLEISRQLVVSRPWAEIVVVLTHEMAHQFVHEVLGVRDESAHGPTFARVCRERGIDARAAGLIDASAGSDETSRVLDRVQKLLALAGSSERHEAEGAMRKAHELMLRHNLSAAHGADAGYEVRHLGEPTRRRSSMERDIVGILTRYFFVEAIEIRSYVVATGRDGVVFEICGTRANVALAEHVFAFLAATAERLWQEARTKRGLPGGERVPFQSGVVRGFGEKLASERELLRGTGLVWVGDAALERFYRARHPRIRETTRYQRVSEGHALGRQAGREVVLHRPVGSGPSGGTRLLGD
ncbi:MAG: SprT-like domain-containing protein [Deltaproteobacteria bacterium]